MGKKTAEPSSIEKTSEDKFNSFWLIWNIVEAALLFVAGVLAIVLGATAKDNGQIIGTNNEAIENVILYVLASFIILDGILRTIMLARQYKKSESSAYLVGGFEITVGIVLMILGANYFFALIINFLGVFLIVIGALLLFVSIRAIVMRIESRFMPVLEILFGAILVGFGIALMIIYHFGEVAIKNRLSFILIGSILSIAAIAMLIGLFLGRRKKAKNDKKEKLAEKRIAEKKKNEPELIEPEVEIISPEQDYTREEPVDDDVKKIEDKGQ